MAYIGAGVTRFNTADELTVTGDATIDTTTLVVDSTNNKVGIGTSSPSALLHIASTGASNIKLEDTDNGFAATELNVENGGRDFKITTPQDTIFVQGSTEAMRILDGGNVGIGTSSPSTNLHIQSTSEPAITLYHTAVMVSQIGLDSTGSLTFGIDGSNGSTERMRIDSSGNLLVGTTDSSVYNNSGSGTGINLQNFGNIAVARDGNDCMVLNRLNSDGAIANFAKDGATVGSIGTLNGNVTIGTGDTGVQFNQDTNAVMPHNISTGANVDASIDLGYSSGGTNRRWKDLYLSGGVYLGGTGSANKLDDYEVGSWSGTATVGGGTVTIGSEGYIKIGDLVHVVFTVNFSGASGALSVYGLPFAATNWAVGIGREDQSNGYAVFTRLSSGNTNTDIWYAGALGNATPFQVATGNMRISLTYSVA